MSASCIPLPACQSGRIACQCTSLQTPEEDNNYCKYVGTRLLLSSSIEFIEQLGHRVCLKCYYSGKYS